MSMKKFLPIVLVAVLFAACNKPAGELVGIGSHANFSEANPYGMVYVKQGAFMMGADAQPTIFSVSDRSITVSVDAFWMDETEITNDEYKQFVYWVRDSIARTLLVEAGYDEYGIFTDDYYYEEEGEEMQIPLNWKRPVPWNSKDYDIMDILSQMNYEGENIINPALLRYRYEWINYDQAAMLANRLDITTGKYPPNAKVRVDSCWIDENGTICDTTIVRKLTRRRDFISNRIIGIYPDTMMWVRDFQYAYNEPMLKMYFTHPGYAQYPVVGVTWDQAYAFCHWRTHFYNNAHKVAAQDYRLPTEAEWEYAARGGRKMALYPWGGNYVRDNEGCFMANFKPLRGRYTDDTGATTMKVGSFSPNDFGLFDMAGNVSEWTSSAYDASSNSWINDMNPSSQFDAKKRDSSILKRKVIKGGSWKDVAYYLQCGTRTYEYQYESRPYIGFRCVRSYIGERTK